MDAYVLAGKQHEQAALSVPKGKTTGPADLLALDPLLLVLGVD